MAKKASKKINVGVIGYGGAYNMGCTHLQLMRDQGMQPVAVCELDPARLKVADGDFPGIEQWSTVTEMLKKSSVDLITIITPHSTHADLVVQCLKAGKHVIVEKPMAITTADCDRMIATSKKHRRMLSTYHNRHWDGNIVHALKTLKTGKLGEVLHIDLHMGGYHQPDPTWRSSKSISGGILFDWGVHLLEYALQIIPDDISEVSGFAKNGYWAKKSKWKKDSIEDEATAVVRFKKGQWVRLTISHLETNPRPGVAEITCTQGTYIMDHANWTTIEVKGGETVTTTGRTPASRHDLYYRNIARYLAGKEKLVITPEFGRRPIHILDLAYRSAKSGKTMKAKYT